jgi:signal transduction histidine kinase
VRVKKAIHILYVEDIPADAVLVNHELRKAGLRFHTKRVDSKDVFTRELDHHPPDLILSDHGLPSFDGFAALTIAKNKCPEVPFIFVTNSRGEQTAIEMFEKGATDYVLKRNLSKLVPAVQRALREAGERAKLKQLESRVSERTAQLEAVNQELEAFSYSVSHDLRAPLRHILGYVDILQTVARQTLDETSRQHLQTIARSATQMGHMIDALLEFSRMDRAEMHFKRVSLAALVEDVRRELHSEIKGRHINWRIGALPEVQGDPVMLRQAIVNLLSNAIKYTRTRRKAKVEIGAKKSARETIFFVRDNGVGFDMNYADKLFGVFQRFHPSSEFEGTGVGLAIVRRIIHQHGGRTWAEGKADGGATLYFSIPKPPKEAT